MSTTLNDVGRKRIHWMDSLRGLSVLLVVLHHAINVPRVAGVEAALDFPIWDGAIAFFAPWRMPLLLVVSGLLLPRAVRKPLGTYLSGKARKLLWPYVIWGVVTLLAAGSWSLAGSPETWLKGPGHLWFLSVLLFVYPVAFALRYINGPFWP